MARFFLDKTELADFGALINAFPSDALASPTRSTVPLLDYWRDPISRLRELAAAVRLDDLSAATLCFEYQVPVQRGRGKASHTDLMILGPGAAVAIEAKYTEPPYETVKSWLREPETPNRRNVLEGWIELIAAASGRAVRVADALELPYQMIHRVASVCFVEARERRVVYQLFGQQDNEYYLNHLSALTRLIHAHGDLRVFVMSCVTAELIELASLVEGWRRTKYDMADEVRRALRHEPLFSFSAPAFLEVGLPGASAEH